MAPAHFFAGWYNGISAKYNLNLTNFLQCYQPNEDLTNDLYDVMEGFSKQDVFDVEKYLELLDLYKVAYANCDKAETDYWEKSEQQFQETIASSDPDTKAMID